jgi:hypothetical protein
MLSRHITLFRGAFVIQMVRGFWSPALRAVAVLLLLTSNKVTAAEVVALPPQLPRYDIDITIDTQKHTALLRQRTTWTNTTHTPANHLCFNFYPNYRVPRGEYLHFAKILEMLRLQPTLGMDDGPRPGVVKEAKLVAIRGKAAEMPLECQYDQDNQTALRVPLPQLIAPGESVGVELVCEFHLPNKQGRLGYWEGVTFITNTLPVLAYCDDTGWRPMPFIPWHQP